MPWYPKDFAFLAIDFRGFGCSTGPGQADFDNAPFENDVLAAVRYLKTHGAKTVSVVGGSFGGGAAGDASIQSAAGEIDRVVFLGAAPNLPAEKLKSRALFIVARDDSNGAGLRLPGIRAQYEKAPKPKELIILDGSAHAQFSFPNGSECSRHARDPAIPFNAVVFRGRLTRGSSATDDDPPRPRMSVRLPARPAQARPILRPGCLAPAER